jgi:putative endonuclease
VARNWRVRGGEIDVIATNGRVLAMCEVKTRTSERFGSGLEAVTVAKQQRLRRLGAAWLAQAHPPWRGPVRFAEAALLVGRDATTLRVVEGAF